MFKFKCTSLIFCIAVNLFSHTFEFVKANFTKEHSLQR